MSLSERTPRNIRERRRFNVPAMPPEGAGISLGVGSYRNVNYGVGFSPQEQKQARDGG